MPSDWKGSSQPPIPPGTSWGGVETEPALTTKTIYRGLHVTAGVLAILAATVIAFGIIPDVRADPGTSGAAVPAFWVNVVCNVLVGLAVLAGTFMVSAGGRRLLLGSAVTLALFLGIALLDAAAALSTHGPALDAATIRISICALADLVAGALIVLAAVLRVVSPSLRPAR